MSERHPSYPKPLPEDPEELQKALLSGQAAWNADNGTEALRFLQRAALLATKLNLRERAGTLAQAVALISRTLGAETQPRGEPPVSAATPPPLSTDFSDTTVVDRLKDVAVSTPTSGARLATRQAVRVAVQSAGSERNLSVRLLQEDEALPPGTSEGILVMLDARGLGGE